MVCPGDEERLAEVIAGPKGTPSHRYDLSRYLDPAQAEFPFTLDLLLEGLESARLRRSGAGSP